MVTFEQIRSFSLEHLWSLRRPITEDTSLTYDFGVAGLDGKQFMEAYASKFGVDLGAFNWVEYFGPEASASPFGLFVALLNRIIRGTSQRNLVKLPDITLGHLVVCANKGKWVNP